MILNSLFKKMRIINLNKVLMATGLLALTLLIVFWFWWGSKEIDIKNSSNLTTEDNFPKSPIMGISCDNHQRRPIAVMLSSDAITRPLSGISEADMVFEMPVTPGGVTRMMAVYQCGEPGEIGSVRSAREDFIALAAGLNAIYAHWGGEHEALKKLDSHLIDNIDAMVYETVYFYRKKGIPQPHNGFTDFEKLKKGSQNLKYDTSNKFTGYPHLNEKDELSGQTGNSKNLLSLADSISFDYQRPFNVLWNYDPDSNSYKRLRGNQPELDKNNGTQVSASVIIVMETTSTFTSKDYLTVITTGEGSTSIYQNGVKINGKWSKDPSHLESKLFFYDSNGKEIELAPGKIWVGIVTN